MSRVGHAVIIIFLSICVCQASKAEVSFVQMSELQPILDAMAKIEDPTKNIEKYYPDSSCISRLKWFGDGAIKFTLLTPRGRAMDHAIWAKVNNVMLDSANWNPTLFNDGVLIRVNSLKEVFDPTVSVVSAGTPALVDRALEINRIDCKIGKIRRITAEHVSYDTVRVLVSGDVSVQAIDIEVLFPVFLFILGEDMTFDIDTNHGRKRIKVKAKDLRKLR